jgi:hypothetical protein
MAVKKSELYSFLWKSCDELRGGMDASQYKDYILVLLFVKHVSDKYAGQSTARRAYSGQANHLCPSRVHHVHAYGTCPVRAVEGTQPALSHKPRCGEPSQMEVLET